ncbi:MAG: sensor domain-containing diguanylate cyclase [Candidatus Obscuribacterales bacterium]
MGHLVENVENQLALLSTIDLDEVMETVARILLDAGEAKAVSILMWDEDLESFGETEVFGPKKKEFAKFVEAVSEADSDNLFNGKLSGELDLDEVSAKLPSDLESVIYHKLEDSAGRCGLILIAGVDPEEAAELSEEISRYPILHALRNSWEVRELRRENERLRSLYDEMEQQNSMLEEQTRKLIHDTMAKESLRTRHMEQAKLLYEISNAVRSSLEIMQVLQTSVAKIGVQFALSRCLILRPVAGGDDVAVSEYHHPSVESISKLFTETDGREFLQAALERTAPHDFGDPSMECDRVFNNELIKQMAMLSGLLVPIIMRDRAIGAMLLQDCQTPRHWSIDDTAFFGSLADNLAVAIENADLHEEKKLQAVTDGLTGVSNRRHFNDMFQKEFERAKRYAEPLSLIIVDLDYLKKINDTYGHQAGDEAIRSIGKVMSQSCRSVDLPARYGGEEFCLLLPNTDLEMAAVIAERLRKLINETQIEGPGNISASIGLANYPLHANETDSLFMRADEALYKAKQSGRNRVCISDGEPSAHQ